MNQPSPGYKTTEFWVTLAGFLFSAFVLIGLLAQEEAEAWQPIVAGLLALIVPQVVYIWSRAKVKAA